MFLIKKAFCALHINPAVRKGLGNVRIKEFRGVHVVEVPKNNDTCNQSERFVFDILKEKEMIRKYVFVDGEKIRKRMDDGTPAFRALDREVLTACGHSPYATGTILELFHNPWNKGFMPVVVIIDNFDKLAEENLKIRSSVQSMIVSLAEHAVADGDFVIVLNINNPRISDTVRWWNGGRKLRRAVKFDDWNI
jgi:hypothetical protein